MTKEGYFWRSLEELYKTSAFEDYAHREFPEGASEWKNDLSRRKFLKLMGASMALGGLSGCYRTAERIIPYVNTPENLVPGTPQYFATAHVVSGYAHGILVESHTGRPTKVEGNPEHPISLGAASIFDQASILDLYSPERQKNVSFKGRLSSWAEFNGALQPELETLKKTGGEGLRVLTGAMSSQTFFNQIQKIKNIFPKMKWVSYEPSLNNAKSESAVEVFGHDVDTHYDFSKAEVVLSLDSDFLFEEPSSIKYAREFILKKKLRRNKTSSNRFYALECTPHLSGVSSDHLLSLNSTDLRKFCQELQKNLVSAGPFSGSEETKKFGKQLATDLKKFKGRSVVLPGLNQPAAIHTFAHLLNFYLGNFSTTVSFTAPALFSTDETQTQLVEEMKSGKVTTLLTLGSNPGYTSPQDLKFSDALTQVPLKVYLGTEANETSSLCDWNLPGSHYLESWNDARAADGTVSLIQPLILPLYDTKSTVEVLNSLVSENLNSSHDLVKAFWGTKTNWNHALRDGYIKDTEFKKLVVVPKIKFEDFGFKSVATLGSASASPAPSNTFELVLKNDPTILDGRFSSNPWLQELPKPLSKLVWGNAAFISPQTAKDLKVENGDFVEINTGSLAVKGPIWILPGQPHRSVTLHFGYGRNEGGINAYKMLHSKDGFFSNCNLKKIVGFEEIVTTQTHHSLEGRDLVRQIPINDFLANKNHHAELVSRPPSLYEEKMPETANAWGMSIDLGSCIGCNACVVACQAENNIPVVGKEQVALGREMHWIRIDRYYTGDVERPKVLFQPVTCMHCEKAPCEVVCPVAATVHSDEGLNEMIYNRCVGTRYCSNNCPYKVRRFNFLEYNKMPSEVSKFQKNPDVSVRSRGVMEKCTYCVQRISKARIEASKENRPIRDGEIKTACQATCPTGAIVFGNINDPKSEVVSVKSEPHQYALLDELGVRPRTTYLARVVNPHEDEAPSEG